MHNVLGAVFAVTINTDIVKSLILRPSEKFSLAQRQSAQQCPGPWK